jgi:putative transcriptional regulator
VHGRVLLCVYTDRIIDAREVRWIISLGEAERKESDAYHAKIYGGADARRGGLRDAAQAERRRSPKAGRRPGPPPTTDEELARAEVVPALLQPAAVREIRAKLGLTQAAFARRFGFSVEAVRNYEQGLRQPPAPIRAYLRVIAAETEAVDRALAS